MRADHAAAIKWYRQAKQRGEDVSTISLGNPPSVPGVHAVPQIVLYAAHDVMLPIAYLQACIRDSSVQATFNVSANWECAAPRTQCVVPMQALGDRTAQQ